MNHVEHYGMWGVKLYALLWVKGPIWNFFALLVSEFRRRPVLQGTIKTCTHFWRHTDRIVRGNLDRQCFITLEGHIMHAALCFNRLITSYTCLLKKLQQTESSTVLEGGLKKNKIYARLHTWMTLAICVYLHKFFPIISKDTCAGNCSPEMIGVVCQGWQSSRGTVSTAAVRCQAPPSPCRGRTASHTSLPAQPHWEDGAEQQDSLHSV